MDKTSLERLVELWEDYKCCGGEKLNYLDFLRMVELLITHWKRTRDK